MADDSSLLNELFAEIVAGATIYSVFAEGDDEVFGSFAEKGYVNIDPFKQIDPSKNFLPI